MNDIRTTANQLNIAVQALALAYIPKAQYFSALGLAEMEDWPRLAQILLEDANVLANPLITPGMTKPRLGPTPMRMQLPSSSSRTLVRKRQDRGMGNSKRGDNGKGGADHDGPGPIDMILQQHNPCDTLDPLLPALMAGHKACKQRYFSILDRDKKGKVVYKLSAQAEVNLDGMERVRLEMRNAEVERGRVARSKEPDGKVG